MNCPVCKSEIVDDAKQCPQCKSDLEAYSLLGKVKAGKNALMLFMILLPIIVGIAWLSLSLNNPHKKEKDTLMIENEALKEKIENFKAEIEDYKTTIANFQKAREEQTSEIPAEPGQQTDQTDEVTTYTVMPGDALWLIAKKHYGNALKYKKIAEDNNISDPNLIIVGQELKIY